MKNNKSQKRSVNTSQVQAIVRRTLASVQERKAYSTQVTGATISSTGAIVALTNGIVEGDDINMRNGTTIYIKRMHFRHAFNVNSSDQSARFIIFRDKMNTGTLPTVAQILPTTGYLSHYSDTRMIQQKRYSILYDKTVDVSVTGPSRVSDKQEINFQGKVMYNGTTTGAGNDGKGAIYLCVIGSLNNGIYDYDWQCEYTDA